LYVALRATAPSLFIDEVKFDELTEVADNAELTSLMTELSEYILKPAEIPKQWVLVCLGNLCVQHHTHLFIPYVYVTDDRAGSTG
jgi:hypothetical protein